jgi:phospholipid transport system substrate-binding protein
MNILKLSFLAFFFCLSNNLFATIDPSIQLKETSENVLNILYSNSQDTEKEIMEYLSKEYNLDIIIRRTLGRNWNKIEEGHRAKIVKLIKQLVLLAYLDGMSGKSKPEIEFSNTRYISAKRAEVPTTLYIDNKPIVLVYRLGLVQGKWEILDIVIENISIVITYRKQFDAFFTNNSSKDLVKKLETLLTDENLDQSLPL